MKRRDFVRHSGAFALGSVIFQSHLFGRSYYGADFTIKMLRNNVGIFTERGGTIGFLLSTDGALVIDSQFPESAKHAIEEINKKSLKPIRFLLNTHHHRDHTSGNIAFKDLAEKVIAHENCLVNMKAGAKSSSDQEQLFPQTTFDKELKLKLSDEKIKGYYFGAAHTNGDAIYHFKETNIMHVGDLMFNKRHPYVDRSAGANMQHWIEVLDKVLKEGNNDTIYIFGHARIPGEETGTTQDIKKFQQYLHRVLDFTRREIKRGVTKEEFLKNNSIPGVTEWTGDGIQRPLTAAYEELTEGNKKA